MRVGRALRRARLADRAQDDHGRRQRPGLQRESSARSVSYRYGTGSGGRGSRARISFWSLTRRFLGPPARGRHFLGLPRLAAQARIGDDTDVHARQSLQQARQQRPTGELTHPGGPSPRGGAGVPISTYVAAQLTRDPDRDGRHVLPSSTRRRAPSIATRRRSASRRLRSSGLGGRPGGRTTSTSSSASRRWAERQARARPARSAARASPARAAARRSPGERARPRRRQPLLVAAHDRAGLAHQALDLDVLGHLAQRRLAQRRQVLDLEEVVQRRRHALGAVDLARAQARDQRLGGEVDEHHLIRQPRGPRRGSSRARARRVSWVTWSLRLSRCWTLTVENTSIPASITSRTSS